MLIINSATKVELKYFRYFILPFFAINFLSLSFLENKIFSKSKLICSFKEKSKEFDNKENSCNFLKTKNGFILSVTDGNIKFSINESGKINI